MEENMNGFDALGVAAARKLEAQNELQAANVALARALRAIHASGVPKCHISERARQHLVTLGFEEELPRLGLSDGNVRVMLDRPRTA